MKKLIKPSGGFFALLMFLPITPSIAAITIFTQSIVLNRDQEDTLEVRRVSNTIGKNPDLTSDRF